MLVGNLFVCSMHPNKNANKVCLLPVMVFKLVLLLPFCIRVSREEIEWSVQLFFSRQPIERAREW